MSETIDEKRQRVIRLAAIYAAFICLGLPETILGIAWPTMRQDFGLPLDAAGILVSITKIGGVLSSVLFAYLCARFSVGLILVLSGAFTMCALLVYSASPWWILVVLFTIPVGLGQGATSSAINGYAAKNYSSRQMNWANASWGLGVTLASLIMTTILGCGYSWRAGYAVMGILHIVFIVFFSLTLGVWKASGAKPRHTDMTEHEKERDARRSNAAMRRIFPGWKKFRRVFAATCFFGFAYVGVEAAPGLWGATLLYEEMGASVNITGLSVSVYWASLTLGRLLAGAVSRRFSDVKIIRAGLSLTIIGCLLLTATRNAYVAVAAFIMIGLGLAPVFPSMVHDIPRHVGDAASGKMIGVLIGSNYLGASILPALMGYVASRASILIIGPMMIVLALIVVMAHEVSAYNAIYKKARTR